MKARLALLLFLGGMALVMVAAFFKIQHWAGANFLIIVGMALQAIGGVIFLYKLLAQPNTKKFLNQ